MAYMQGFEMGAQLGGGIPQMKEQQGINFNKDIFVQELETALNGKKAPTEKEMQELGKQLQQLLGQAQERFMKNAPKQQGQAVPQQGQKLTPEQAAQLKKAAEAAQKQADAKKAK